MLPAPCAEVPANTRVWLLDYGLRYTTLAETCGGPSPQLIGPDGGVEFDLEWIESEALTETAVLTPHDDLVVGGIYRVLACHRGTNEHETVGEFEVTSSVDLESPSPPEFELGRGEIHDRGGGGGCSGASADLTVERSDALVVLDIDTSARGEENGILDFSAAVYASDDAEHFDVGQSTCQPGTHVPEAGDKVDVRLGTYDLAGNFSGWSETQRTTFLECACASTPTGGGLWFLALIPMFSRRRYNSRISQRGETGALTW